MEPRNDRPDGGPDEAPEVPVSGPDSAAEVEGQEPEFDDAPPTGVGTVTPQTGEDSPGPGV